MLFVQVWFAPPSLVVVLGLFRVLVRAVGHPRRVAYLVATVTASLVLLVPHAQPTWFAMAGVVALAYTAILRLPGQGLGTFPAPIRGSVIGLSLSLIWPVGSMVAIGIALDEYRQGRQGAAGWILATGAVLPATLLFADLWRDDAPALNYLITAAFGSVVLIGLGLIGPWRRAVHATG